MARPSLRYFGQSGVAAKLDAARDVLAGPHRICDHFTSVAVRRSICGQHPRATGEMCDRCLRRHVEGHDAEHTCASCGRREERLTAVEAARGSCVVAGLGICPACRAEGVF